MREEPALCAYAIVHLLPDLFEDYRAKRLKEVRWLPLLSSNCAPDRLRRLAVDADERPPHVFCVTEADHFRDEFDRFGSHLYAASSQVGTEPFHHTCGCAASLCPECTAELAQAHASRLRQAFDGEQLGDVIAGIARAFGYPVMLGCQVDGSGELRLPAMTTVVNDEVLRDTFGDGKAVILLDQCQSQIDAGGNARRRPHVPVPTEDAICIHPDGWVVSVEARGITPMRRRSTPIQQFGGRQRKGTRADARHTPASAPGFLQTAERCSG